MTNKPKFILYAGETLREGEAMFETEAAAIAELAKTENIAEDEAVRRFFAGERDEYLWAIPCKKPQVDPDALRESLNWEDGEIDDYKFSADILNRIDGLNYMLAEEIPQRWRQGPEIETPRLVSLYHDWDAFYHKKRTKLSVASKTFLDALAFVAAAAAGRNGPLAGHVCFEVKKTDTGGTVRLAAGGADLYAERKIDATVFVPGVLFVRAKTVTNFLETLDADADIAIEEIADCEIGISQGMKSATFSTCSSDEPFRFDDELAPVGRIALDDLKTAAGRVCMSTDSENSRYALGGVLLSSKPDQIAFVATCGRRLHVQKISARETGIGPDDKPGERIVSRRGLETAATIPLDGFATEILIAADSHRILFSSDCCRVASRLVDGRFPRWENIIPTPIREEPDGVFEVGPLYEHFKAAAVTADDKSPGLALTLSNGNLTIESNRTELGQSRVTMPVQYLGKQRKICLDRKFLLSMLAAFHKESRIAVRFGEDDPFTFESADGFTAVIIPIK